MNDLVSSDTLIVSKAKEAIHYYPFDTLDLPVLEQTISQRVFEDDSLDNGIRALLIEQVCQIGDNQSLDILETIYQDAQTHTKLRTGILISLMSFRDSLGIDLYTKLFLNMPPKNAGYNTWQLLRPFYRDHNLAITNIESLLALLENQHYRSNILNISASIGENRTHRSWLLEYKEDLIQYFNEDLSNYKEKMVNSDEEGYVSTEDIYPYLRFADIFNDQHFVSNITSALQPLSNPSWLENRVTSLRVKFDLPVENELISAMLDSVNTRLQIMKALYHSNNLKRVPKKYREQKEFAKLCLYDYLFDDDYPEDIELLGSVKDDKQRVYIFSFSYPYSEETYIGLSGGHPIRSNQIDFENVISYCSWDLLLEDWEAQATGLINDMNDHGYNPLQ